MLDSDPQWSKCMVRTTMVHMSLLWQWQRMFNNVFCVTRQGTQHTNVSITMCDSVLVFGCLMVVFTCSSASLHLSLCVCVCKRLWKEEQPIKTYTTACNTLVYCTFSLWLAWNSHRRHYSDKSKGGNICVSISASFFPVHKSTGRAGTVYANVWLFSFSVNCWQSWRKFCFPF